MPAPLKPLVSAWRPELIPPVPGRVAVATAGRAFLLAGLASRAAGPVLALVPGEREAEELADDLGLFTEHVVLLPAWETLPFEHVSPNEGTMARRAQARHTLTGGMSGAIIVASARAAAQRISPSPIDPIVARVGEEVPFDRLVAHLGAAGYTRVARVETRGEFTVRGGIIDVFPAQSGTPIRLDLWGDLVESVRTFSVSSQRSEHDVAELVAFPPREVRPDEAMVALAADLVRSEPWAAATWDRIAESVIFPGIESWLPWLAPPRTVLSEMPPGGTVVVFDPVAVTDRARDLAAEESDLAEALAPTWGFGAPADHPSLYLDLPIEDRRALLVPPVATGPDDTVLRVRGLDATPGDPDSVAGALSRLIASGATTVVAMDGDAAADRVARVLGTGGIDLPRRNRLEVVESAVLGTGIHHGFHFVDTGVAVFGEQSIAGRRRAHRRVGRRVSAAETASFRDLREGDYVVHYRHGIGRFEGLVAKTVAGVERDYLIVAYAAGDKLYVPTDQLDAIRRYTGGEKPRVSRMGGADWSATKARVRKAVAAVAEQVVSLHRARATATGHAFGPDGPWQRELDAAFPFEETPDQMQAIEDVKADMQSERPMDRLVFGDVGFGKTEIAVRAAFRAATGGRQTAVLCPTTLLAQQHFQTFTERFEPFPIRVAMLSRFLGAREQKSVVRKLATGEIDVVIGTHRLLSEDIRFKDLGLLVVDEEQRFGVGAKDAIKGLRVGVDVLTLTATPIPRTLEMALTGIRDVSHIRTAPEDRHPILTYVGPLEERSVSAAIRREMLREGQVFYVHNRVQSIDRAVARLRELVPNARYAVAHGQMSEGQLEQVMLDFWNHRFDVLVATTIIESGLDLPTVNTLLVERADLLGLAQLYQLRGRVGRSSQRAYAYLFHPPEQSLSEEARRRLRSIGEHTELGSGFDVALRDLEIRGAGSILGEVQSGHIAAVGFDLYARLVAEAVGELEGRPASEDRPAEVRIEIPVNAYLAEEFIPDQEARLEAYRRLATATTVSQVADVAAEWKDRYGPWPGAVDALLAVAELRAEALRVGLEEIVSLGREVRFAPVDLSISQEVRLQRIAPKAVLRAAESALFLPSPPPGRTIEVLSGFVREMWPESSDGAARQK
ncbi:MAG: transcription-repair coupling factor [Actinobacteria bacterium]|nr:transcription-repair coupling factor [Actinomycetota bacterium]